MNITVSEFYTRVGIAIVEADAIPAMRRIHMHPFTWKWLCDQAVVNSVGKPLKVPSNRQPPEGAVGVLHGVPVYLDAGVSLNSFSLKDEVDR